MGGSVYSAPVINRNYRKRPVVIQAAQYTGTNLDELKAFGAPVEPMPDTDDGTLQIRTLEDGPNSQVKHAVTMNDWIIRGVRGEFYACKPDIFEATYEQVPDNTANLVVTE
jgi:hypothetical protein